jgi:hypothetical protein
METLEILVAMEQQDWILLMLAPTKQILVVILLEEESLRNWCPEVRFHLETIFSV